MLNPDQPIKTIEDQLYLEGWCLPEEPKQNLKGHHTLLEEWQLSHAPIRTIEEASLFLRAWRLSDRPKELIKEFDDRYRVLLYLKYSSIHNSLNYSLIKDDLSVTGKKILQFKQQISLLQNTEQCKKMSVNEFYKLLTSILRLNLEISEELDLLEKIVNNEEDKENQITGAKRQKTVDKKEEHAYLDMLI